MPTALVLIANEGFEPIEAFTSIDVLTRGGIDVQIASVGGCPCTSAYGGILVTPPLPVQHAQDTKYDVVVLPGGMPGAKILGEDLSLAELLREQKANKRWIAAICAAPVMVLKKQHLLDPGVKAVCYPGMHEQLGDSFAKDHKGLTLVEREAKIITSSGPASAMEFGLAIVAEIQGEETALQVKKELLCA